MLRFGLVLYVHVQRSQERSQESCKAANPSECMGTSIRNYQLVNRLVIAFIYLY